MQLGQFRNNNSLSIVIFSIFIVTIVGMSVAGWMTANETRADHEWSGESYGKYVVSGEFIEGVFENWESEFLQMWALVMLTIYLRQKGSSDSKPMRGTIEQDTSSRLSIVRAGNWGQRAKATRHFLYAHSLGLALLALFITSFVLHAVGGAAAYNEEATQHGTETVSTVGFVGTSEFWYQSLQNWQSEFLAVGTLMVLSIYLRERGSPQSKPVGVRYDHETG